MKRNQLVKSNPILPVQPDLVRLALAIAHELTEAQIVKLVIMVEQEARACDVSTPLYKYFKEVTTKEDPESL